MHKPPNASPLHALLWALAFAVGTAWADEPAEIRALMTRGDLPGALERAHKAQQARPTDPQARFLYGFVLMELKRDDEALALFTRLAQEYPELPDPFNNIALLHARAGRLELARLALEAALRNQPGHRAARANLGQVHLMLAVQAWEQAAASGPLDAQLLRRLEAARTLLACAPLSSR
ncbi:MAG: tetratricopeptide repeat protein [Rubrivivax sp.]|nr:tetratricopeptide repeat protein [Rubrivivax sp.]